MNLIGRRSIPPLNLEDCFFFKTFGICRFKKCRKSHVAKPFRCEFSVQKVISEFHIQGGRVTMRKPGQYPTKQFYIYSDFWNKANAKQGDLVILQKSEAMKDGLNIARVICVLCNSCDVQVPVAMQDVECAFTLDVTGTQVRDDAISVVTCHKHPECKKIGIHVIAFGIIANSRLQKIHADSIDPYGLSPLRNGWGMDEGKLCPSLAVFFHTKSDEVSDPMISVVKIDQNYEFGNSGDIKSMEELWKRFVGTRLKDAVRNNFRYWVDYTNSWRDPLLLDFMSTEYSKAVSRFAYSRDGISFITTQQCLNNTFRVCRVSVFKDECDKATPSCRTPDDVAMLLSRSHQFLMPLGGGKDYFSHRYQSDVETFSQGKSQSKAPVERGGIKCTSPLLKFKHFINQQILIRCLVNPHSGPLYTRDDLLGLLVPRFRAPTLEQTICNGFIKGESSVLLDYIGRSVSSALSFVEFSVFNRSSDIAEINCKVASVYYTGLSCADEDYCNRNLVHFDYAIHEALEANWRKNENLEDIFQKLDQEKSEETSPYQCKIENGERSGTTLTLQRGADLQMQISTFDVKNHGISLGLRMLRIGRNCHLCFTHINYPEKAFMSDRNDVRKLINNETIFELQRATTNEILESSKQIAAKIQWLGDYMSGGSFELVDAPSMNTRDLLCIRKEIIDGSSTKYIWCCHGIVNDVTANTVQFVTCTLSQLENQRDNSHCHVTIIFPETVKSKVNIRKKAEAQTIDQC